MMRLTKTTLKLAQFASLALACFHAAEVSAKSPPEFLSDSEILSQYEARREYVIDQIIENTDPMDASKGSMFNVAANLSRGANVEWARKRLVAANQKPSGAMFWMHPMVLLMENGRGVLNDEDWAFIQSLWKDYFPYRGDTENHWVMYYASLFLACEMFPDAGPEQWYNGKSSAENMAESKEYLDEWVRITTSYGQGEYDSPNYIEEYLRPLSLLAGWAQDPEIRQQSKMMMDYIILDFVVESIDGLYGGGHSRLYPRYTLHPSLTAAAAHAWLLFGQGEYRANAGNTMMALSGYTPPPILYRIAHGRGDEAYVQRELKRTRWRLRNTGPDCFEIDEKTTKSVYKYSYVHPDFILGSSQGGLLQPIQQQTWSLIWREDDARGKSNTMFGVQPSSSPIEGTMFFPADWDTVTDLIARSKVDYDSPDKLEGGSPYERIFQDEATLIALYDIAEDARFPLINTIFTRDLVHRVEDESKWIFGQGGPVYVAYRPFVQGEWREVDWTGLLKGGAGGWFSTNFEALSKGSESYVSEAFKNGYIVEIAPVSEFESYEAFQDAIRALPLEFSLEPTPSVTFKNLAGKTLAAKYGGLLSVDGKSVDRSEWKLFDSPFSQADRESESLEIRYGQERYNLDFKTNSAETSTLPSR